MGAVARVEKSCFSYMHANTHARLIYAHKTYRLMPAPNVLPKLKRITQQIALWFVSPCEGSENLYKNQIINYPIF